MEGRYAQSTMSNCWRHAVFSLIPLAFDDSDEQITEVEQETDEFDDLFERLAALLLVLPTQLSTTTQSMDIDTSTQTSAVLSDAEIVDQVKETSQTNSEEHNVDLEVSECDEQMKTVTVSSTEAKQSVETLRSCFLVNGGAIFLCCSEHAKVCKECRRKGRLLCQLR